MNVVFLAAGKGSRMGTPKVLMEKDGAPWLTTQLRALRGVPYLDRVLIVVEEATQRRVHALAPAASVIVNPDPSRGPFSSLYEALRVDAGPCFVSPIDVPVPSPAVFDALLAARAPAAIPTYGGKGGHPVLLTAPVIETILLQDPRRMRLDHLLHQLPTVARVAVNDATVLTNLNSPADLR